MYIIRGEREREMCVTAVTSAFSASIFHVFASYSLADWLVGCYILFFFFFLLCQLQTSLFVFPIEFIHFSLCEFMRARERPTWTLFSHSIFTRCMPNHQMIRAISFTCDFVYLTLSMYILNVVESCNAMHTIFQLMPHPIHPLGNFLTVVKQ